MKTILCPTRGGEGSIPNQKKAISLAREENTHLVFLYVSNVRFLDHAAGPVMEIDLVEDQLDEVGEFLVTMAQERADGEGVKAETAVMRGSFRSALETMIEEKQVSVVVLGSAYKGTGLTTPEYRKELAVYLSGKYQVEILVTDKGEVIERYPPPEPLSEEE